MASESEKELQATVDTTGWSANNYNKTAAFVYSSEFTAPVLDLLGAQPGERILDIGCGSGELSVALQTLVERKSGGLLAGTDFSPSMVEKARVNGLKHVFRADAQELSIPEDIPELQEKFDAVFSNAALHWCKRDPLGVVQGVRRVLKPGGRFVAEMGGFMNVIGIRSTLHDVVRSKGREPEELDPWFFPSVEDYRQILITSGFEPNHLSLIPRITPLPTDLYDWLNLFVRNSFLRDFTDEEASDIMREVEERLRVDCRDVSGKWTMMYTRLRFSATLKVDDVDV